MTSRARGSFARFGALAALLWTIPAAAANQAPIADAGPDKSGVSGGTITFDARGSRDPDGTVAAYYWQFGDGTSITVGTATVGHVYAAAGTYYATLWVRDAAGTWSSAADIARATVTTGTTPTTTTSTTTRPVTTTTLSGTNKAPTADAGPNQATQTLVTLTFNGSSSRDSDGSIALANWIFGDGTSSPGLTTTHAYQRPGTYTATLQVLDNRGAFASDTATITVANRTPVANAGADVSGTTTAAVNLYGGGSSDADGSIASYAWTFGDGTSGSGMTVAHTYATAGTYTATLRVTDDKGASASDTAVATIVVTGTNPPSTTWAKKLGAGDSDGAYAVCTDAAGNAFVAGNFRSRADFGGATLQSVGGADGFVVKYAPTGAVLWSRNFGGSADDTIEGCAVDGGGDVVVAGRFAGTANFGGGNLVASGTSDMVVAKYAGATGAHVWSRRFGGAYDDTASAVAVDGSRNVYFTGYFRGTVDFGGGPLSVPFTTDLDTFVAKLTSGGQYAWAKKFTNTGNERGYGIAADAVGNVAITGSFSNTMSFGGADLTATNAMTDGFVARFTSAGAHQWSRRFGASDGNEGGYGVAIDPSGNVLVTGAVVKACDFGGGLLSALGGSDAFIAKYSASSGAHVWSRRLGGLGNDYGYGVAVDDKSNVYVSGAIGGVAGFGGLSLTALGPSDAFVAKYGPTGVLLSARGLGGLDADTGRGVALSGANPVTVGYFYGGGSFGGTTLSSAGMADGFVARIAP